MVSSEIVVGILALQGAFIEHIEFFKRTTQGYNQTFRFIEVRTRQELESSMALVIPGGESTTISLIAERAQLLEPLMQYVRSKRPIWGTCAGLIFLAKEVLNGRNNQQILGGLDIQVQRNAFGRQVSSFEARLDFSSFIDDLVDFPAVFIRAPVITKIIRDKCIQNDFNETIIHSQNDWQNESPVEVLYQLSNGFIVAVRQGHILGTSFHPELSEDHRFHKWFIDEFVVKAYT